MQNRKIFSATGLVLTGLFLLVGVAIISALPGWRIDLTEDRLYTLADGTRNIVSELEDPVELLFFYSESATADVPQLRGYGTRVRELMEEMVIASGGMLSLDVIDPEPFSVEEDLATELGVQAVPLTAGGEEVYFGLVVRDPQETEAGDTVYETMPLIRPDQESFLEYEFARLITQVANPEPPTIGILSSLNIDGGFNPATAQPTPAWSVVQTLEQLYQVDNLDPAIERIPDSVDTLLIVHPQSFSEQTLYAIDQFVLAGGSAMVFVDPNSDTQTQSQAQQSPMATGPASGTGSDLAPLLAAWGVDYTGNQVVTDQELAIRVTVGQSRRPMPHLGMLAVLRPGLTDEDIITGRLENVNLASSGALMPTENAGTRFEPLIQSSSSAMLMESAFFESLDDPSVLIDEFSPSGQRYTLAARVQGPASTAFPDGRPQPAENAEAEPADADADPEAETEEAEEESASPHISESEADLNLIIVADTDLLADRMWVQVQNFFGERITQAFANNGDFVVNAMDNLAGNPELVSIRSRGRYSRPFTRVLDLQREADDRLRQEETELLQSLEQTEQQIAALSQGTEGDINAGPTPEQQAEIERFYDEQLETRRRLREVQLQLNRDIENLGAILKLVNTILVPVLLTLLVLVLGFMRSRRRSRK